MQLDAFNFHLPDHHIALEPAEPRDGARLLEVMALGGLCHGWVKNLPAYFQRGDALILNDSRVIPAALNGVRSRGDVRARVQINLHKRVSDYQWLCFAKPAKKLKVGDVISFSQNNEAIRSPKNGVCFQGLLSATVSELRGQGEVLLSFEESGPVLSEAIENLGTMPLPPYIISKRHVTDHDRITYQTVYSRIDGSVAAPTAGLHFTDELLLKIKARGVKILYVTLHVGAGTFLPVKCDDIADHSMHSEWGEVSVDAAREIAKTKAEGGRIFATGTTSLRLLEAAALKTRSIAPFSGETDIFITPGFKFSVVDRLLTNFHLPKSTLFMLVSAFSGVDVMQRAYGEAISQGYRFYSYGDCCLLEGMRDGG